jgi:DNA polymerase-3 subunit epsilon
MIQFPEMENREKEDFLGIISSEVELVSRLLETELSRANHYSKSRWPLFPILATDFISSLRSESMAMANSTLDVADCDARCMIRVDHYSLVLALQFILECLQEEFNVQCHRIRLSAPGNLVQVDLMWDGPPIPIKTLRQWNERSLDLTKSGYPLSLKEIMLHHNAEIWPHEEIGEHSKNSLRLFLPRVHSQEKAEIRKVTVLPKNRPDFYDFDLFSQAGQTPEVEARLLGELTFTVFDTETTGLDPRGGDEIISIGAVRVVNGRLLHTETIHQLVDPKRTIPGQSIKYHGISDEMVKGKPTIDKVLPYFYRFSQNTVLVAHNAAFDMRMLQMKEKATGIHFINPVLDTMHLSAVLHPSHRDHDLDAIAQRLGVSIAKRHDALGDAITTGEVFLKMIPLLNKKGVYTLKDALTASQRTFYAKKKY